MSNTTYVYLPDQLHEIIEQDSELNLKKRGKLNTKKLALLMAIMSAQNMGYIFIDHERLHRLSRISIKQIPKYIKSLIEQNYLSIDETAPDGSCTYRVLFDSIKKDTK